MELELRLNYTETIYKSNEEVKKVEFPTHEFEEYIDGYDIHDENTLLDFVHDFIHDTDYSYPEENNGEIDWDSFECTIENITELVKHLQHLIKKEDGTEN